MLPKLGQHGDATLVRHEMFTPTEGHRFQFGGAKPIQQLYELGILLPNLLAQSGFVG